MCAHAVRVAIRKLEGIESVDVSLERASADMRLRPANRVTLPQLRQIIKNNGFSSKDASVTVVGTLSQRDAQIVLTVTGTDSVWQIDRSKSRDSAYAAALEHVMRRPADPVQIVGVVAAPASTNQPDEIAVETLAPVAK